MEHGAARRECRGRDRVRPCTAHPLGSRKQAPLMHPGHGSGPTAALGGRSMSWEHAAHCLVGWGTGPGPPPGRARSGPTGHRRLRQMQKYDRRRRSPTHPCRMRAASGRHPHRLGSPGRDPAAHGRPAGLLDATAPMDRQARWPTSRRGGARWAACAAGVVALLRLMQVGMVRPAPRRARRPAPRPPPRAARPRRARRPAPPRPRPRAGPPLGRPTRPGRASRSPGGPRRRRPGRGW
jgi:hypothetical protein